MPILGLPTPVMPPPVTIDWSGIQAMTWTGWDATEWDLTGRTGGVSLQAGTTGFAPAKVDRYSTVSPALPGSRHRGTRTRDGDIHWLARVASGDGSKAWIEYDRAFWRTMDPDRPGQWAVTAADGATRTLDCRFVDHDDAAWRTDPSMFGWNLYGLDLLAEQPYWRGEPLARVWDNTASTSFFGPTGYGPPFYISSGSTIDSATFTNPGDVEAYPVWKITGPTTGVQVGIGDRIVQYVAPISAGHTITIDTRPERLSVVDQDGVRRVAGLGQRQFAPIPPGVEVPLSLAMTGTGIVEMVLEPLYRRYA